MIIVLYFTLYYKKLLVFIFGYVILIGDKKVLFDNFIIKKELEIIVDISSSF